MHALFHLFFNIFETVYHRLHRLRPMGSMLYIGTETYKGSERIFDDGTRLLPGDVMASIHFNNQRLAEEYEGKWGSGSAFRFARIFIDSMQNIAEQMLADPDLKTVNVFSGITWFKPHGRRFGFSVEPLPNGLKKKFLRIHFRMLLKAILPAGCSPANSDLQPHQFWLTRDQLLKHFYHANNRLL